MKIGNKVKVIKVHRDKMPNLYGNPTDITHLIGEVGKITKIIDDREFGIEFENDKAQLTRLYTGIIFNSNQLEVIS